MKKAGYILIVAALVLTCNKEKLESPDCEKLLSGLAELNENLVKNEVEKLTVDLHPQPSAEDQIGHIVNIQTLAERIGSNCNQLTTSVTCYACIYTYPPQSEILVEFEYDGSMKNIVIDIVTSDNDILRFGGLHPK